MGQYNLNTASSVSEINIRVKNKVKIVGQNYRCGISVVTPIFNEEKNISTLFERLVAVMDALPQTYEIVAVNDGSSDSSLDELRAAVKRYPFVKVVDFRRNFGQTAALMAGIDLAEGEIVVMLDADLQNDPVDIPRLVEELNRGYDVVSGWRVDRKDHAIRRNMVSRVANGIISRISGVHLNDYGCTLKAYRAEVLSDVCLYGEMHRFIPIYASWMGARVTQIPVKHHARLYGKSNYGLERVIKVILDLIVVTFLDRYFVKPIYVFGSFGFLSLVTSFVAGIAAIILKIFFGISFILTPLPLLSAITFLIGFLSIFMGLLAEMILRTYFESQGRRPYAIREVIKSTAEA